MGAFRVQAGAGSWLCCSLPWAPASLPLQHPFDHCTLPLLFPFSIPSTTAHCRFQSHRGQQAVPARSAACLQALPLRHQPLAALSPPSPSPARFRLPLPYLLLPAAHTQGGDSAAATAGSQRGQVALAVTAPHFHALDAGMETLSPPSTLL